MKYSLSLLALTVLLITGCTTLPTTSPSDAGVSVTDAVGLLGSKAGLWQELIGLTFEDLDGTPVSLAQFDGQAVVINSWASWCIFCTKEIPDFVTVQKEFEDRVQFVVINRRESADDARAFFAAHDPTNALVHYQDVGDLFYAAIGGFAMPETLFVRPDGIVMLHKRGPMTVDEIRGHVQKLLE